MAKQTFTTGQVLTAAQMTSLQQTAMLGGAANAKVASYVLVAADAGDAITMSNGSATTITVNTGLFAAGDIVTIINLGAGVCTITAGTATVTTSGSLALAQNQGGVLRFTSASAAIFFQFATPASGDIEGVTAGTGISGGGTSGTVTITNSMATEITAKGDLIVGTGNATFDNLPVGTNGYTLVADSSVSPTGLKWAAPASGGGMTVIASGNLSTSSSTLVLSSIPGTYYNLQLVIRDIFPTNNNKNLAVTVNSVTDNDFFYYNAAGVGAIYANATINVIAGGMANTNDQNYLIIDFFDYANTDSAKCIESVLKYNQDGGTNGVIAKISGAANTTSAITSITITMGGSDNFGAAGSYVLYGVK